MALCVCYGCLDALWDKEKACLCTSTLRTISLTRFSSSSTECARSKECHHHKQEYDACVERVTAAQDGEQHKGPHEDCVEECTFIPTQFAGKAHFDSAIAANPAAFIILEQSS